MIRGLGTQAGLGWTVLPVHMVNILLGSFLFFFFGEQTGSPRRRHLHGFSRFSMWLLNLMTGLYSFLAWWVFCLVVGFLEDML